MPEKNRRTSLLLDEETITDLDVLVEFHRESSRAAMIRRLIFEAARQARQELAASKRVATGMP